MARMADRLLARGVQGKRDTGLASALRSCERIIIDDVQAYFDAGAGIAHGYWEIGKDFPNLAPPFPIFWMEAIGPKMHRLYSGELRPLPPSRHVATIGVLVEGVRCPSHTSSQAFVQRVARGLSGLAERKIPLEVPRLLRSEIEWGVCFSLYLEGMNRRIHHILIGLLFLDKMGVLIDTQNPDGTCESIWTATPSVFGSKEAADEAGKQNSAALLPFFLAISLMHCKNVELVRKPENPKLARAYRRRYKEPMLTYHVLDIEPMKPVLRDEGDSEHSGIRHALHICRGHFKDYRQRGLFGKHKGLFWWESHLRGSADEGTAIKDYRVRSGDS